MTIVRGSFVKELVCFYFCTRIFLVNIIFKVLYVIL